MRWFSRSELLLGEAALERLRASRVVVFGMGGVGSFVVEALARAGVGELRLVDHDVVSGSNLNRQLFALRSTVGMPKVEVAKARVLDINPECHVDARQTFVRAESIPELLEPRPHAVVDAIDSVGCKVALLKAAHGLGIPTFSSMGAGGRVSSDQVKVADLSRTRMCKLAFTVRKRLRKEGVTKGIRCVYSLEAAKPAPPPNPLDVVPHEGPGRARRPLGTISYMPAVLGLKLAEEVLRYLLSPERL
jgi:tRNA A37 threonylcarbamoyladenosine dehydratase